MKNVKKVGLKQYDDPNIFIEFSNDVQDVQKNIEEYNLRKKRKVSIVFDDMIADMISNNHILMHQRRLD